MLQLSSNYSIIFYSFLFCFTRIIVIYCGETHEQVCKKIFSIFVPFTFIFPFFADFYMIPSQGGCKRLKPPFSPNAISLSFGETLFNIRTDNIMLGLSFIAPVAILVVNSVLVFKVRQILFQRKYT
ncbi:hypothetical protein CAEBREN_00723 [Caenorhabditis brenneri]|uniref:Uncharacterized protein n=1 Tax=Caenorhabditis brenneri TaxID=135651 RepID=G0N5M2_CAEBE|nr:hypothetical protein CAEBREN_00723 [Caenorhabditis brenneri]